MNEGSGFRFAEPLYLHGIWVGICAVILFFIFVRVIENRRWRKSFSPDNWNRLVPDLSNAKRNLRVCLLYLAFVMVMVALARPQMGTSLQATKSLGVELIIAFDVSESMLAEDNKPSRLEFAKAEVSRLLDRLGGDRVGLVAFAGSAFLVSPITSDKAAIKLFLDGLTPSSVSTQGTNISEALKVTMEAFERGGVDEAEFQKNTRVVIVVSDGEDHEDGALKLANELASKGTRIFTWGFGTAQGAPIPERDEFGNLRGYKKDRSGQVIMSTATDKFLKGVAEAGRGKYVHAVFGGQAPEILEKSINELEKTEMDSSSTVVYDEKFQIPLSFAVMVMLFGFLVSNVKKIREAAP